MSEAIPGPLQPWPNGAAYHHTPPSPPKPRQHRSRKDLSRLASSYGPVISGDDDADVKAGLVSGFGVVDSGSLMRIAEATEKSGRMTERTAGLVQELTAAVRILTNLLTVALQQPLALASEQYEARRRLVYDQFDRLMAQLIQERGPCPGEVRYDLLQRYKRSPMVKWFLEGFKASGDGSAFDCPYSMLEEESLPLPTGNSKEARRFAAWGRPAAPPSEPIPLTADSPIGALNWLVRPRKAFNRLGIETLGQLCEFTADELLDAKNFGMTSLCEVRDKLAAVGLHLKCDKPPRPPLPPPSADATV